MPRELLPELISEILLCLPVKSLLRFRCLSNSLCGEIDSPNFARIHLKRSIETRSHRKLIFKNSSGFYAVDFDDGLRNTLKFNDRITDPKQYYLGIIQTCHGLILFQATELKSSRYSLLLWNPATRQFKMLPDCPYEFPCCMFPCYGLGYDSASDDYKVVVVSTDRKSRTHRFCVFSLKSNSWRQTHDFHLDTELFEECVGFANGFLFLIYHEAHRDMVGCFDLANEVFITLSSFVSPNDGGCLDSFAEDRSVIVYVKIADEIVLMHKYYEEGRDDEFYSLVVDENETSASVIAGCNWSKTFMFETQQVRRDLDCTEVVIPLAFSKDGAYVLLRTDEDIYWYNRETKMRIWLNCSREISKANPSHCLVIWDSLVSLGNDGVFQDPQASIQTATKRRTRTSNDPVSTAKSPRTEVRTRSKGIRIEESSSRNSTVTKPITRADARKAKGNNKGRFRCTKKRRESIRKRCGVLNQGRDKLRPARGQPTVTLRISKAHPITQSQTRQNLRCQFPNPQRPQKHPPPSLHHDPQRNHHQHYLKSLPRRLLDQIQYCPFLPGN